jgi:CheY-like chemotaxis protein
MSTSGGKLTGTGTILKIRNLGCKAFIIGYSGNDMKEEHIKAGADYFCRKPISDDVKLCDVLYRGLGFPSGWKILLVDDVDMGRKIMKRKFNIEAKDWIYYEATNGESAKQLIREHDFNIIVLDEELNDNSKGTDVAKFARQYGVDCVIIGYSGHDMVKQHKEAGCDLSWTKPAPNIKVMKEQILEAWSIRVAKKMNNNNTSSSGIIGSIGDGTSSTNIGSSSSIGDGTSSTNIGSSSSTGDGTSSTNTGSNSSSGDGTNNSGTTVTASKRPREKILFGLEYFYNDINCDDAFFKESCLLLFNGLRPQIDELSGMLETLNTETQFQRAQNHLHKLKGYLSTFSLDCIEIIRKIEKIVKLRGSNKDVLQLWHKAIQKMEQVLEYIEHTIVNF